MGGKSLAALATSGPSEGGKSSSAENYFPDPPLEHIMYFFTPACHAPAKDFLAGTSWCASSTDSYVGYSWIPFAHQLKFGGNFLVFFITFTFPYHISS